MKNKLYETMDGKYDDITMKNLLASNFINLGTDSMIRYFVEQKTNKDSISLKELERKYIKGGLKNEID